MIKSFEGPQFIIDRTVFETAVINMLTELDVSTDDIRFNRNQTTGIVNITLSKDGVIFPLDDFEFTKLWKLFKYELKKVHHNLSRSETIGSIEDATTHALTKVIVQRIFGAGYRIIKTDDDDDTVYRICSRYRNMEQKQFISQMEQRLVQLLDKK